MARPASCACAPGNSQVLCRDRIPQVGGEAVSLLVPCADMANHLLPPNASYRLQPEVHTRVQDTVLGMHECQALARSNHLLPPNTCYLLQPEVRRLGQLELSC